MKSKKKIDGWFSARGYLHFDDQVHEKSFSKIKSIITNPDNIKKWAFYPFLKYSLFTTRFEFDEKENKYSKINPKERVIMYSAHMDSQVYSYYSYLLSNYYEDYLLRNELNESITAFRKIKKQDGMKWPQNVGGNLSLFKVTKIHID